MVIGIAVYALNFATFPEPPSEGAVDLGPLIGLWYAVVSVLLLRRSVLAQEPGERAATVGYRTEDGLPPRAVN